MAQAKGFYSTRFRLDDIEGIKKELDKNGVVVITDVVNPEKCDELVGQYRGWLRNFNDGLGFPDNSNTIIHKYGVAHLAASWEARLLAKPVFAAIWDTQKLLTSFDGVAIGKPPETGFGCFHEHKRHNLHLDQGPKKKGLHAYQGALYLEQADADDWCFQVMTKSHKVFEEFFQIFNEGLDEHRLLNDTEVDWMLERGCEYIRVPVPKGGMVLWDSRLVHAGAPPGVNRKSPDRWRFVNFISMTPAIWATPKDMDLRQEGFQDRRCSRHWSSCSFVLFEDTRGMRGPYVEELPAIALEDEARLLAGDLYYDFGDGTSNGPQWMPVFSG